MFDWPVFLRQRGVPYVERGSNVAAGNIAIHCPFCGHADASQHMEISVRGQGWRCWRNYEHRGKSPVRLVAALVPCTLEQAAAIAGVDITTLPSDWLAELHAKLNPSSPATGRKLSGSIAMMPEFRILDDRVTCRPYVNYLRGRGFPDHVIYDMSRRFGIRIATEGPFKSRIIIPVMFDGRLVSWTGRTVSSTRLPRYHALTADADLARVQGVPQAIGPITDYLLFYDRLYHMGGDVIYLVEGPMDCLKVWTLGEQHGILATCLFTTNISREQYGLLHTLLPRFRRRILLLDRHAEAHAFRLRSALASLDVGFRYMPDGFNDPGELRRIEELRV